MEILKGMVKDAGYPDEELYYTKIDENTMYYFIKDYKLKNGNMIATNILKEAIGHAPYTSLGLINESGQLLIPFENKQITNFKDDLLLVEKNVPTSDSVVEALKNKNDPFNSQAIAENTSKIKQQLNDIMGSRGELIFDNQFSEAAIYTMDGVNIANKYFSFIGNVNDDYYLASNVLGDTIMKFSTNQTFENDQEQETNDKMQEESNDAITNENDIQMNDESEENTYDNNSMTNIGDNNDENTPLELNNDDNNDSGKNSNDELDLNIPQVEDNDQELSNNNEELELNIGLEEESTDEVSNENELSNETEVSLNDEENNIEESEIADNDNLEEESNYEKSNENLDVDKQNNEEQIEEEQTNDFETADEEADEEIEEDKEVSTDISEEPAKQYSLTDEDIATPTIKDATNTIRNLLEENRKQRKLIDKQIGEIEALKTNSDILREENYSHEQEIDSLRNEMNSYRNQCINLTRENAKLTGVLERQNDIVKKLEEQNTGLRSQVAGMHALSDAIVEANALVQPMDNTYDNSNNNDSNLDIDKYLSGNYYNNGFSHLDNLNDSKNEISYHKAKAS